MKNHIKKKLDELNNNQNPVPTSNNESQRKKQRTEIGRASCRERV